MIAALGMYDWPQMQAANDRLWARIRDHLRSLGIPAPDALTRGEDAYLPGWRSPDLVLSQTCGLPYRTRLHGRVSLVGTPDYGLPGLRPGHYQSVLIASRRTTDTPGGRLAYNDEGSQSGWAAPLTHAANLGWRIVPHLRSGSHRDSILAVAEGRADLAAIDAVTWRLALRYLPTLTDEVRVIGHTAPTPGLPLITRAGRDPEPLFAAVAEAIRDLPEADRDVLGLHGIVAIPADDYLAVPTPEGR